MRNYLLPYISFQLPEVKTNERHAGIISLIYQGQVVKYQTFRTKSERVEIMNFLNNYYALHRQKNHIVYIHIMFQ